MNQSGHDFWKTGDWGCAQWVSECAGCGYRYPDEELNQEYLCPACNVRVDEEEAE